MKEKLLRQSFHGLLIFCLIQWCPPVIADKKVDENLLRAVFVERFTRFIDWPFSDNNTNDTFNLCVFDNSEFSKSLESIYQRMKIKNKTIAVLSVDEPNNTKLCNLIYLSRISLETLGKMLTIAEQTGVLMVSEFAGYAELGVHINLYQVADKLKLEVNPGALKRAGFKVDSRLLRYAKITNDRETPK